VLIGLMAPDLNMPKAQLEDILYAMFREKEAPLIEDLHRIAQEKGHDELAQAVYQWHRGSLKNIFSHPTDVKLDADYIVFDISEMDEDLRPVAMQVILSWLWRQIFANPRPRIIYVDEAWCLLSTAASWFSAAYRRARKHWAGFTITEHQVETLLESDVMKSILVNSATKLLFAQEPSALKALTEAFDLTDMEQTAIISADQGSGLLYTGNNHVSLKVVAPEEFHRFLSTTPSELYGAVAND
jgi:conjugal transfer ATP-binding protein TraC